MVKEPLFAVPIINFDNHALLREDLFKFYQKISDTKDDRSFVLLAALVFENILDELLFAIMPAYKKTERTNVSAKIKFLAALNLIGNEHIEMCRLVIEIRNEFAHKIEIDSLQSLSEKLQKKIRDYHTRIHFLPPNGSVEEVYRNLINWEIMSLMQQEASLRILRQKIEAPEFIEALRKESDWQEKHGSFEHRKE